MEEIGEIRVQVRFRQDDLNRPGPLGANRLPSHFIELVDSLDEVVLECFELVSCCQAYH